MPKENWFNKLFIDEAKPALKRHSGSGGGGGSGIIDCDSLPNSGIDNDSIYRVRWSETEEILPECEIYCTIGDGRVYDIRTAIGDACAIYAVKSKQDIRYYVREPGEFFHIYVCLDTEEVSALVNDEVYPLNEILRVSVDAYAGFINDSSELDASTLSYGVVQKTKGSVNTIDNVRIGIPSPNAQVRLSTYDNENWERAGTISNLIKLVGCRYLFSNIDSLSSAVDFIRYNDTRNVIDMTGMFMDCHDLITVPSFDTSMVLSMKGMFGECYSLKEVPPFNTSRVCLMTNMFFNCHTLTTIPSLDMRNVGPYHCDGIFSGCYSLTDLWLRNIRSDLEVFHCELLTQESLVHLIKELRIMQLGVRGLTLTVGTVNLKKLENVYVRLIPVTDEMRAEDDLIDEKYPCEVCESTDEGATLIIDYANSKGWNIA